MSVFTESVNWLLLAALTACQTVEGSKAKTSRFEEKKLSITPEKNL